MNRPTMQTQSVLCSVLLLAPLTALHAADALVLQPLQYVGAPQSEQTITNRTFTGAHSSQEKRANSTDAFG